MKIVTEIGKISAGHEIDYRNPKEARCLRREDKRKADWP
jgi:hypothetical protein